MLLMLLIALCLKAEWHDNAKQCSSCKSDKYLLLIVY
jgi:hypothetical protein